MTEGKPEKLAHVNAAIDAAFAKRMRATSVRLVLWFIAILVAVTIWPEQRWIKWLLLIPLISMLIVAAMFVVMKRAAAKSKALQRIKADEPKG